MQTDPPTGASLSIEPDPPATDPAAFPVFRVSGELDISNAERLVEAVRPAAVDGGEVVLHLADLRFMDSSGIWALLQISSALGPTGRLVIDSPSPPAAKVLRIVGAAQFPGFVIRQP